MGGESRATTGMNERKKEEREETCLQSKHGHREASRNTSKHSSLFELGCEALEYVP